jgi:hypothetical protein
VPSLHELANVTSSNMTVLTDPGAWQREPQDCKYRR